MEHGKVTTAKNIAMCKVRANIGDEGACNRLEKLANSGNVDAMLAMAEVFM